MAGSSPSEADARGSPIVADCHVHTTVSDGTLEPAAVVDAARAAELEAVAITDHDRINPFLDAPVAVRDGVTVVNGIELKVGAPHGERVDLLGYGLTPTPALAGETERLQNDRIERTAGIVDRVEEDLGLELDVAIEPGVGRPDVAREIDAHPGTDLDFGGAFDELIGDDGPCFIAREIPDFERGHALLSEACAVVGLAHPLRYADPAAALGLCADLDAVELHYPYSPGADAESDPVDLGVVEDAIDRYDLLVTGGSDAHGEELGRAGVDAEEWTALSAALPDPVE